MAAKKRIQVEYKNLLKDPIPNCVAEPLDENDLFHWKGKVQGQKKFTI